AKSHILRGGPASKPAEADIQQRCYPGKKPVEQLELIVLGGLLFRRLRLAALNFAHAFHVGDFPPAAADHATYFAFERPIYTVFEGCHMLVIWILHVFPKAILKNSENYLK